MKEKAGVVAYRQLPGAEPQVLLVTSRKRPSMWVFPVGSVEKGETLPAAAARECLEESGWHVSIGDALTEVKDVTTSGRLVRFTFYLAAAADEAACWEDDRERQWVPLSQATALLPEIFHSVARAAAQCLERQRLRELLLAKSCRTGTFTLSSGRTSDFYIDGKQTTLDSEGGWLCGRLLFDLIRQSPQTIGGVGGMTLGADPLVTAVSLVSHLAGSPVPAFIVRKEAKGHGTGSWLEGRSNLRPGCAVALLEDVVTTGGTLLKVIERVRKEGFAVGLVATVVDREEGGAEALAEAGCPLQAVFTRTQLIG